MKGGSEIKVPKGWGAVAFYSRVINAGLCRYEDVFKRVGALTYEDVFRMHMLLDFRDYCDMKAAEEAKKRNKQHGHR